MALIHEPLTTDCSDDVFTQVADLRTSILQETSGSATPVIHAMALRQRYKSELLNILGCALVWDDAVQPRRLVATAEVTRHAMEPESAYVDVYVVADMRHRGIGSALLDEMEAKVPDGHQLYVWTCDPLISLDQCPDAIRPNHGEGAVDPRADSARFLVKHGYVLNTASRTAIIPLPIADEVLDELDPQLPPGYQVTSFHNAIPDQLYEALAELNLIGVRDQPGGDPDERPEITAEILSTMHKEEIENGKQRFTAFAFDPDGNPVGFTSVVTSVSLPRAYQGWTIVRDGHRGIGLGLAMKIANLKLMKDKTPELEFVETENTYVNAPMLAINKKLGFRLDYQESCWRKSGN